MFAKALTPAFTTDKVEETRDFYVRHFDAKVEFDCGWYVSLKFGEEGTSLQFMSPTLPHHKMSSGAGLIYNFNVEDVDAEYERLIADCLEVIVPLEDHPWGDRGFAVQDPNEISLYIYSDREPSEEFQQYFQE
jgi:uncharacterized glyoxalase superfamily protein PhnB